MSTESHPSNHEEAPDPNLEFALSVPIVSAAQNALAAHDRQVAAAQERASQPSGKLLGDITLRTGLVATSEEMGEAVSNLRYALHTAVGALAHLSEVLDAYYNQAREAGDRISQDLIAINIGTAAPDDLSGIS